jgi:hypothetical protein
MLHLPLRVVLPKDHPRNKALGTLFEAPPAAQDVVNHGGPLLTEVQVTTAFLGSAWTKAPYAAMRDTFNTFLDDYLSSSEYAKLSVYGIGKGSRIGTLTTSDTLAATELDSALQSIVKNLTKVDGQIPAGSGTLVFLFTPPGTIVDANAVGAGKTCTDHCGYHNFVGSVAYAVVPYLECSACIPSGMSTQDAMTFVASHELCEAVTDPMLNAWYSAGGEEIGDICAWQTTKVNGYIAQKEWINGTGCG